MLLLAPIFGLICALTLCLALGKRYFKDLLLCVGGILFGSYAWLLISAGPQHYDKWLLPVINGLYYGLACFFIFVISIRLCKSNALFFLLSCSAALLLLYFNISAAMNIHLTERIFGYDTFINGKITAIGILYKMLNPLTLMAMYASIRLVAYRLCSTQK